MLKKPLKFFFYYGREGSKTLLKTDIKLSADIVDFLNLRLVQTKYNNLY